MNESETCDKLITPQLEKSGWMDGDDVRVYREHYFTDGAIGIGGNRGKRLYADYVLEYKNSKLAVVEAKRDDVQVRTGIPQAKEYADKLGLPTCFAANGKKIYEINNIAGDEGLIKKFPTPQELWQRTFGDADKWLNRFNEVPFDQGKAPRYYQELAVNRTMKAIAGGKRRILLNLATGTGKTFIAFQIAWKLFESKWTLQQDRARRPRILFITDRNFLADQALEAFEAFGDDALIRVDQAEIRKRGEMPMSNSVFFTIFQTLMSGDEGNEHYRQYASDFFDLVIIDECHRGGADDESTWRKILEHFDDAVHLGLTATPKRDDNINTYEYFDEVAFTYSLRAGVADGFLTPFKVKSVDSNIDEYQYQRGDKARDSGLDKDKKYGEREINRKIFIRERERERVQQMLKIIKPDEKTIVFCVDQKHAKIIRDLINEEAGNGDHYCVRVTADDGAEGERYLKQFQDNEKLLPTVLTTSEKLTTGVDARNLRNIVLLRTVTNIVEFKQIVGRGTRIYDDKHYFTIVDFVNAYYQFSDSEWDGDQLDGDIDDNNKPQDERKDNEQVNGDLDDTVEPKLRPPMVEIKLSDGRKRKLHSTVKTLFYVDGKSMSAEAFVAHLVDTAELPKLLGDENKLRQLWSKPETRSELLRQIEDAGCRKDDLLKLQELINAQDSDLFDVLAYIAYTTRPVTRESRVKENRDRILNALDDEQREFVDYVLDNYIKKGVDELDEDKISTVVTVKYGSVKDAKKRLGDLKQIRKTFINFQPLLYNAA